MKYNVSISYRVEGVHDDGGNPNDVMGAIKAARTMIVDGYPDVVITDITVHESYDE